MDIDEKPIKAALLKGERVTLECKKAQSNVPIDMWKTYSAFANTYGGLILLGVHEDLKEKDVTKRFTIIGVNDAEKIRKDIWNVVNNPEKVSMNLLKDEDVEEFDRWLLDNPTIVNNGLLTNINVVSDRLRIEDWEFKGKDSDDIANKKKFWKDVEESIDLNKSSDPKYVDFVLNK